MFEFSSISHNVYGYTFEEDDRFVEVYITKLGLGVNDPWGWTIYSASRTLCWDNRSRTQEDAFAEASWFLNAILKLKLDLSDETFSYSRRLLEYRLSQCNP